MQTHTTQNHALTTSTDERVLLLKEVDFKWLMAGQGWWIDTARLHNDPAYAAQWLDLVESTGLPALKDCATQLRAQVSACH